MNKNDLKSLKKLSCGVSLLYIEDNKVTQKQVVSFLENFFENLYVCEDGLAGFNRYKELKPQVVLTDLTLNKKNSIEMIADIQGVNLGSKIIVLSSKCEEMELLEFIDMGLSDILFKPFDKDQLLKSLVIALQTMPKSKSQTKCYNDLESIFKSKHKITLINSYKGIPVADSASIVSMSDSDNEFTLEVSARQLAIIKYEEKTVINLGEQYGYIHGCLIDLNRIKRYVTLSNPKYIDYHPRQLEHKRVQVGDDFKISIRYKNKTIEADVLSISAVSMDIYVKKSNFKLKVKDKLDITMGYELERKVVSIKERFFAKTVVKGNILRVENQKGGYKIAISFDIKKSDSKNFANYLQSREIATIKELKELFKKY